MKMKPTLLYRTSLIVFFLVASINIQAQNDSIPEINKTVKTVDSSKTKKVKESKDAVITTNDSTKIKLKYGLRVGADFSKLLRSALDDDYQGFEINGDFRLSKHLYAAAEIGTEEKNTITDYMDISTTGAYLKAGVDYNMYDNWLDMDNMIFAGFRVGGSAFSHDLNEATIYTTNQYWTPQLTLTDKLEFNDLTAFWAEVQLGIKAEVLKNLYMGLNVQLRFLVTDTDPGNFENVYIPGFGKTYDSNGIGAGYGYTIAYRIPLFSKYK
ncbi:DUF6048 family protein [Tamlana sp. 2_MG-2023]|uniref:DUF6048 family protein n=1 Tax=unclassified Tamlana TaxID=2614803 RepID=UPI0026E40F00|nr:MULTISPECIES: DUF6048 family protein [unclassified Tamlana]MDO6759271.1 DUF6048 family protein [Tamlana sp. 2_MG-2023]MDO6790590.1 DUF6048 family protein [Tamlana sp. 1_MG-2023]